VELVCLHSCPPYVPTDFSGLSQTDDRAQPTMQMQARNRGLGFCEAPQLAEPN